MAFARQIVERYKERRLGGFACCRIECQHFVAMLAKISGHIVPVIEEPEKAAASADEDERVAREQAIRTKLETLQALRANSFAAKLRRNRQARESKRG